MKTLTWETAKNEGAVEALNKLRDKIAKFQSIELEERMELCCDMYAYELAEEQIKNWIEEIKKQYK